MLELTFLVPMMMLSMSWCAFLMTQDLVLSLVMLLLSSLALPLVFMEYSKVFWPCGLLLILMSTGLIVIFAYIVSIHSWKSKGFNFYLYMWTFFLAMWVLTPDAAATKILHSTWIINVKVFLCLVLFFLLLFLVISFIRIIYSKGGGFRKKF